MFIIQTKDEKVYRDGSDRIDRILETLKQGIQNANKGGQDDWKNQYIYYETLDEAKEKAVSLIESGTYRAANVRIVEVVTTFKSRVEVMENEREDIHHGEGLEESHKRAAGESIGRT